MSDRERIAIRILLTLEWEKAREEYRDAGQPFGEGRGLDLWTPGGLTGVHRGFVLLTMALLPKSTLAVLPGEF